MDEETEQKGYKRKEDGTFDVGTAPGPGRTPETPEDKIIKKATKQIIADYKDDLAQILPEIRPIIRKKALEGDMVAIKEIHDRVMDKAKQGLELSGEIGSKVIKIDE